MNLFEGGKFEYVGFTCGFVDKEHTILGPSDCSRGTKADISVPHITVPIFPSIDCWRLAIGIEGGMFTDIDLWVNIRDELDAVFLGNPGKIFQESVAT